MNCDLCKRELDAYREGRLPDGIRVQIETHLQNCHECAEYYKVITLAEKVMDEEKSAQPNPFLSTRIMAGIDALKNEQKQAYQGILKPVLISVSIVIAVFLGITMGQLYKPAKQTNALPTELTYMDDASMESLNVFVTE
jgi:predicted anti-sigma-YlaC factor YlaD